MNPRTILSGAACLAAAGGLLWILQQPPARNVPAPVPSPTAPQQLPLAPTEPAPTAKPAPEAPPRGRDAGAPVAPPATPGPATSSVMAGAPMVRTVVPVQPAPVPAPQPAPTVVPGDGRPEMERVHAMLRDYRTRMKENPVGSNAEIMRAVMGGNPVGARLGPPEGQELNSQGELLDRWGTPYFFHQLSATSMEIRSAGPDGRMWTPDDVVSK